MSIKNKSSQSSSTKSKRVGPIRWNAIIPFLIISAISIAYFHFFFDSHIRNAMEWVGYKALGAEVNIREFKSSFLKGNVQINGIELTDSTQPQFNSIELGSVRFDVNWDALLRVKFVVEEIAVEGLKFMSKRSRPGKVDPPTPPSPNDGPSFTTQLQGKALDKLGTDNKTNVLGDVAEFLKSGNLDTQVKNLEGQLASKKLLEDLNTKWTQKKADWDKKIKSLPTGQELNKLKDRFSKIKYKDFKSPQELQTSLSEIDAVVKDVDSKSKQIQEFKTSLESDLKGLDQDYKNLDSQIKNDISNLKNRFKIPKIDAATFAKALFMDYLTPVISKVDRYRLLAQKYLPPKYAKSLDLDQLKKSGSSNQAKPEKSKEDDSIQPHPRAKGVTYEFPITKGYPLFWIQKIKLSSSSTANADYGDFKGTISDITSNQRQVGRPTTADIRGDFKSHQVNGVRLYATLDNTKPQSEVKFNFAIGSYQLSDLNLLKSNDSSISIPNSDTSLVSSGQIIDFSKYSLALKNNFKNVNFRVKTPDKTVTEVLSQTFSAIKSFDLDASVHGEKSDLNLDIQSSLGGDLQRAFENLLKEKIAQANEQLQKSINAEIDKLKSQLQANTDGIKNQAQSEINKVQSQVNDQKKLADEKIALAKKDFENQAKNKLQDEAKKKLDDLKKKFGF